MEIRKILVRELNDFVAEISRERDKYQVQPIDKVRACAHSKNPNAKGDDLALVVAYSENKCIAYTGVIATAYLKNGVKHKTYAHTTFYVHPSFRKIIKESGKTVGELIIDTILETGDGLITTGLSSSAEKFFLRNKETFTSIPPLAYSILTINRLQPYQTLSRKALNNIKNQYLRKLLLNFEIVGKSTIDKFIWLIVSHLCLKKLTSKPHSLCFKEVKAFMPLTEYDISDAGSLEIHLLRDHHTINWMLHDSWLITGIEPRLSNYYFEICRKSFHFKAYEIFDKKNNRISGLLTLSISTRENITTLKVLDSLTTDETCYSAILCYLIKNIPRWNINQLHLPDKYQNLLQTTPLIKFSSVEHRGYFIALPLSLKIEDLTLFRADYCDCDRSFA
ncbi:MAG: hypothetical protein KBC84_01705 [Proteobacteria bacterium]|nr:hypothetical protein [Pseudomonadota bacterium]